ncbi:hypothetical protein QFZ77_005453 [Paenibacillus sp. V4I3]|nr:hypothetical protein [Paenibacillus sp. V4I3]
MDKIDKLTGRSLVLIPIYVGIVIIVFKPATREVKKKEYNF